MTVPVPSVGDDATAVWADAVAAALNNQYLGDTASSTAVTLSTTVGFACGGSAVTFTLTTTTRVRIFVLVQFTMAAGTNATYYARAAYNAGSAVVFGSVAYVGGSQTSRTTIGVVGQSSSAPMEGTALLPAGTYTAYPVVARLSGGSVTDTAATHYCAVYSVGST